MAGGFSYLWYLLYSHATIFRIMDTQKQMFEGNWKCSGCSAPITKLPFNPKSEANLRCIDCFKKGGNGGGGGARASRPIHQGGDWKCAGCGNAITQLPFEPRDTSNLKCIDCFKKSKGPSKAPLSELEEGEEIPF